MSTMRLLEAAAGDKHDGEAFACAFTADGTLALSGGWDGCLRLWDAATGAAVVSLPISPKPLSACAAAPDDRQWLAGSMEGLLSVWDPVSHQPVFQFVAHTRPISDLRFAPDGQTLATASWDRQIVLRKAGREREGRALAGHQDIVAGCRFSPDGGHLLSWSHDRTLRLWEVETGREVGVLSGHTDRVNAAGLSPDGRWAVSGGRDGTLRLWDLEQKAEVASADLGGEVRACFCLLDGESLVSADAAGQVVLMKLPDFEVQARLEAPCQPLCGDLSPTGMKVALGGEDGRVHFVALEGFENSSLVVTARQGVKQKASLLGRFLGKPRVAKTFLYTCPTCRQSVEADALPDGPVSCPKCRRRLRVRAQGSTPSASAR